MQDIETTVFITNKDANKRSDYLRQLIHLSLINPEGGVVRQYQQEPGKIHQKRLVHDEEGGREAFLLELFVFSVP